MRPAEPSNVQSATMSVRVSRGYTAVYPEQKARPQSAGANNAPVHYVDTVWGAYVIDTYAAAGLLCSLFFIGFFDPKEFTREIAGRTALLICHMVCQVVKLALFATKKYPRYPTSLIPVVVDLSFAIMVLIFSSTIANSTQWLAFTGTLGVLTPLVSAWRFGADDSDWENSKYKYERSRWFIYAGLCVVCSEILGLLALHFIDPHEPIFYTTTGARDWREVYLIIHTGTCFVQAISLISCAWDRPARFIRNADRYAVLAVVLMFALVESGILVAAIVREGGLGAESVLRPWFVYALLLGVAPRPVVAWFAYWSAAQNEQLA